jgi:hypothetical protein
MIVQNGQIFHFWKSNSGKSKNEFTPIFVNMENMTFTNRDLVEACGLLDNAHAQLKELLRQIDDNDLIKARGMKNLAANLENAIYLVDQSKQVLFQVKYL